MQSFKEINVDDTIYDSRTTINDSIKTVMSNNSGTAFPTTNLQVGMKCYRTDLGKTYTLTDVANKTWKEDNHATIADNANKLSGYPLHNGGDSTFGKIPVVGDDGVLKIGKYIDFHSANKQTTDVTTRITANDDDGTLSVSGSINANLNGNASSASSVPWSGVTGKPSTYPPSGHNHDSAYPATNGSRATGTWGINITGKANTAETADNAIRANTAYQLAGFTRKDDHTWGSETGEQVANFLLGDGSEIAFRKNNPVSGKASMLIDGVVYQNEGLYQCIDENSIKDYLKNYLPLSGGAMEGNIHKSTNDTALLLYGGKDFDNGSELALYGKDLLSTNDRSPGGFRLTARNGTQNCPLLGSPDGRLLWDNIDLAGAGIVSQQLSEDASYIKYANGLLVQFGTMLVQGYAGVKAYIKTLPISFKEVYSMQATLGYPRAREVSSVQIESNLTVVKLWIFNFVSNSDSVTTLYGHWLMIGTWK